MHIPSEMMIGTENRMIINDDDGMKENIKIHKKLDFNSHVKKFT